MVLNNSSRGPPIEELFNTTRISCEKRARGIGSLKKMVARPYEEITYSFSPFTSGFFSGMFS
jgi:hypothetical protein